MPIPRPAIKTPLEVPLLLAAALGGAVAAAALVVLGRFLPGGVVTGVAGALLILAGMRARRTGSRALVLIDHAAERLLDALILGAIAWAALPDSLVMSAAALAALATSYMASYLRAKARGLGFNVDEDPPFRTVRLTLVTVALLVRDPIAAPLWGAALVALSPIVRHGVAVARQREPAS